MKTYQHNTIPGKYKYSLSHSKFALEQTLKTEIKNKHKYVGGNTNAAVTHTLPSFDDAKKSTFSPSKRSKPRRTAWSHLRSLSRKVFEFWVFWFALCSVLGLKGVFVTTETEVGYGGWRKHTSGGLSDTFQTTGRQSDFLSNHRKVICNYP